jgi:MoaA/NifB/PqqE/SkfB family radical SAM enzyme
MCFKWKPDLVNPDAEGIISTEDIKKFLRELRQLVSPGFIYSIAGGEIFLRKDLIEIFRFSKTIDLVPQINTNGWLVNKKLASEIVESGVGIVNFSVDGSTKEVHDKIRGTKGSFDRINNAIDHIIHYKKQLNREFPRINIQAVLQKDNLHQAIDMMDWVEKDSRINLLHFNAINSPNNVHTDSSWYTNEFKHLWPANKEQITKVYEEIKKRGVSTRKIGPGPAQAEAAKRYFLNPMKFAKPGVCNFYKSLQMTSTGDVYMCGKFANIGNIREVNVAKAWKSDHANDVRNKIKECRLNCHQLINCYYEE